jgi:competence CoiA-like predicted nuclease
MSSRTVQVSAQIAQYLIQALSQKPELVVSNASFLEGWMRDLPMGRGLDEQVIQLASIVRTGVEALPERFECPICEEALSVREGGNAIAGELICSMWHVWSE